MAAYVIADIDVADPAAYEAYKSGVLATVTRYGGRFLSRGAAVVPLEGGWTPGRLVLIEFPDMASLQRWYGSPEYAPLLAIRLQSSSGRLIAVEGT